ncbi:MAG: hypothetical protein DI565_06380 [Ancylobacter novellus]|uniref:Uncharacterized protein n=1 Tax=Ancylobacter novellus TaxID=921 RepID=A0A2W5MTM2_ANCNO|nr:MAG: hypothetical protein DI565_06380 [Ancylobacter novellus]
MSIVLYALGVGLIGWSGYLLASGDSFAVLDIATRLAGWGVFAIGLGAIASVLGRLTRAVETGASASRSRASPQAAPFSSLKLGPLVRVPADEPRAPRPVAVEPTAPQPQVAEPKRESFGAPTLDPAPARPRPAPPIVVVTPPVADARRPDPEPRFEPSPEPEATREIVAEDSETDEPQGDAIPTPSVEPHAGDDDEAALSKKERRQRRREERRQEEAFERPRVVAPVLGGGQLFAGRDRRTDAVGPVAPPTERAERPVFQTRNADSSGKEPESASETAVQTVSAEERVARPETPAVEETRTAAPVVDTTPVDAVDDGLSGAGDPDPKTGDAVTSEAAEERLSEPVPSERIVVEPNVPEKASEPKVPEWLARARARREARSTLEQEVQASQPAEPEPIAESAAVTEEAEAETSEVAAVEQDAPAVEPSWSGVGTEPQIGSEPEPEPEPEHEPAETEPGEPQVVREGEHRGVTYRFFDDGSVEALSPHGSRRFATVEELRATVIAARGPGYAEEEPDPVSEPAEPAPAEAPDQDPLEAALSELEGDKPGEPPARRG